MSFSRRKFIISSVLTTVGVTVFSSPLIQPLKYLTSLDPDLEALLLQAKQARLDENYTLSETLYNQVIQLWPQEIRGYFGLRKTLLSQKHKEYNVVRLFEQAVQSNPEDVKLICQLAKEYTSVALGNKQVEDMLDYETPLLEMSQNLYNQALLLENPPLLFARGEGGEDQGIEGGEGEGESQASVGLDKVETKIDQQADVIDARDNAAMKIQRKSHQLNYKSRFDLLSDSELISELNTLKAKPHPQYRSKQIKELYRLNIKRKKLANDIAGVSALAYDLHLFDKNDTYSLGLYKRAALHAGQYSQLVTVLKDNDILQATFWSKLGYFDALQKQYENGLQNSTILTTMTTELSQMENNFQLDPSMQTELSFKKIELEFLKQNNTNVELALSSQIRTLVGSTNTHYAIRFCRSMAKYYKNTQQNAIGIKLINNFISNDSLTESDVNGELQRLIYEYSRNIQVQKQCHFDELYIIRQSLYNS